MRALTLIPAPETYGFVLYRTDWNPETQWQQAGCGEIANSRCIDWPAALPFPRPTQGGRNFIPSDKDRRTCMLFVRSSHFRTRLLKLGWAEVEGFKEVTTIKPPAEPKVKVPSGTLGQPLRAPVPPSASPAHGIHARSKKVGVS